MSKINMNLIENIPNYNLNYNINNDQLGIYNIDIQPNIIDNTNYNLEEQQSRRKQNRHLRILLVTIENLVFESNNRQFNDFSLRELSLMMGLSSLRQINFPNIIIGPQTENQIRNFIDNNINNNDNIINNDNNTNIYDEQILSDSVRILRCCVEELIFNSIYINNQLLDYTFREIIRIFGLYNLDSNNFPNWRLSFDNRSRIINFIDSRQRTYLVQENMNFENEHNLNNLLEELLNVLRTRGEQVRPPEYYQNGQQEIVQNQQFEDSTEDRLIPKCSICLENNCSIVLIPCGHACVCHDCCSSLRNCPICRRRVSSHQTLYL